MKKIEVREIRLTDFKGQQEKRIEFGHRTVVSGKNGCGKTTLADAFMWVFCDKDYSLKSNPDIRPDDGRECLPRVDIDIAIDGKPVSVAKFQKRTESKPKDGKPGKVALSNKYEINGVPKAERDFKADLKERGFDFDNFLMLSHMEIFTDLKDADARKILFSMSDGAGKSDLEIAKTVTDCAELVPLLETYKADEIKAMNSATLKKAEEQLKAIPNQIIGMEQSKVDADTAELELQKNQEELAKMKNELSSKSSLVLDKEKSIMMLKDEIEALTNECPQGNNESYAIFQQKAMVIKFKQLAEKGVEPSSRQWDALDNIFESFFRQFKLTLENNHKLSENEYRICMLVWLGFTPYQMKILMNMSSSNISNIRKRLSKKLFDKEMTTSKFDDEIRKIRAVD